MSLLARASHGVICRGGAAGGAGGTVTVYVPRVVEGLVGVLSEDDEILDAPMVEEELLAGTVLTEDVPVAGIEDDEEAMTGVLVAEELLVGVLDD